MPYSEQLSNRVREALAHLPLVTEKHMFGGVCYMVNGKMCIGISGDKLMCRIGEQAYEEALEQHGCTEMAFTGKPMKGYVYVHPEGMRTDKDFKHWINLCLAYKPQAKASKKQR